MRRLKRMLFSVMDASVVLTGSFLTVALTELLNSNFVFICGTGLTICTLLTIRRKTRKWKINYAPEKSFLQRRRSYREQWPGPVRRHTFLAETCKLFRRFVRCSYLEPQLRRQTTNELPESHERDRHFDLRVYSWRIPLF